MSKQQTANSKQRTENSFFNYSLFTINHSLPRSGFTLIETLVAVSVLMVAIVAPMSLASKSLATAYYSRDQITAFHLAQEALESVRHTRDHNVLQNAFGVQADLLSGIPSGGNAFTIDTRDDSMTVCPGNGCPPLETNGNHYGYHRSGETVCSSGQLPGINDCWGTTHFTRTARANFVGASTDEVRISVEVRWQTGAFQSKSVFISENLYRWVNDGVGQ